MLLGLGVKEGPPGLRSLGMMEAFAGWVVGDFGDRASTTIGVYVGVGSEVFLTAGD